MAPIPMTDSRPPNPPAPSPNVLVDMRDHDLEVERERADHRHHQQWRAHERFGPRSGSLRSWPLARSTWCRHEAGASIIASATMTATYDAR